jgi:hypothetical protein
VYERELGDSENRTEEYKLTGGLSFMIIDQKLSIGPAFEWAYEVERDNHVASRSREFHAGPSIQIRPIPKGASRANRSVSRCSSSSAGISKPKKRFGWPES